MNSRQRILAAIRRETADRVPCSPHVSPGLAERMPAHEWQGLLRHTDVTMSVSALGDAVVFGGAWWQEHRQVSHQGSVTVERIETPLGPLTSRWVDTPEASWVAEHLFKDLADVDKLFSIPYAPAEFDLCAYWEWMERLGDDGLLALGMPSAFRFCLAFFGSQQLYTMMADDADLVERLVATMNERLAGYIQACCLQGVDSFWMGGSEHCGPGVVNPAMFRRMVTPYDKRIVAIIHAYGGIVNLHTHGKLRDILDEIAEIGVDVMSPIETGLQGDVTLAYVKERVGDRICLKGNLDDMAFLFSATEAEVRAAAVDVIGQAAAGGGYILSGTDAGIYSPEWYQSFLILADVAAQHTY